MSKKRFIQSVVVRKLPAVAELPEIVLYGEQLWEGLTRHGYGSDQVGAPRESRDWLAELSAEQRRSFDAFWTAFAHKADRNGAAMRWAQLGVLNRSEYQAIIAAARAEASRVLPAGQVRKMAQGWLFEKRWLDFGKAPVDDTTRLSVEFNRLVGDLNSLRALFESSRDPALVMQITALEAKIKVARDAQGGCGGASK